MIPSKTRNEIIILADTSYKLFFSIKKKVLKQRVINRKINHIEL